MHYYYSALMRLSYILVVLKKIIMVAVSCILRKKLMASLGKVSTFNLVTSSDANKTWQ